MAAQKNENRTLLLVASLYYYLDTLTPFRLSHCML